MVTHITVGSSFFSEVVNNKEARLVYYSNSFYFFNGTDVGLIFRQLNKH